MNVSVSIDWLNENQATIQRLQQENEELRRQVQQQQQQQQQTSRNNWQYYNMRNGARVRHTTARGASVGRNI
jgi:predicted RNase H-like nuclease (RuvC/YqgF family)